MYGGRSWVLYRRRAAEAAPVALADALARASGPPRAAPRCRLTFFTDCGHSSGVGG